MTPSARRAGILTGLILSMVCALGFAHRSRGDLAARCRAEVEAREARESELDEQREAHAAEMDAVGRRIAALESDLARERGLREELGGRVIEAAKPDAELEAAKAELARAYARIGELERGDGGEVWGSHVRLVEGKQVDAVHVWGSLSPGKRSEPAIAEAPLEEGTEVVFEDTDEPRIRSVGGPEGGVRIRSSIKIQKPLEDLGVDTLEPQRFEGGLNQGIDYVDPAEVSEKLEEIRKVMVALKEVQREETDFSARNK